MLFLLVSFIFCKPIVKNIKDIYAVFYGSSKAECKLESYFDIGCAHCAEFYRHIFPIIKKNFCDKGKLLFVYKPYPIHQETLVYMSCCTVLNHMQKQALFETLMEIENSVTTDIIYECMKVLKTPRPTLTSRVIREALSLTQRRNFKSLPVIFLNGKRLDDESQDNIVSFLEKKLTM